MLRYHGYLRKSAYEGGGEEPTVLLDSAAARLVKTLLTAVLEFEKPTE